VIRRIVRLPKRGQTRDCLDPWNFALFRADGRVHPCCAHSPIGDLRQNLPADAVLNGPAVKALRQRILTGALDPECSSCHYHPLVSVETFRRTFIRETFLRGRPVDAEGFLLLEHEPALASRIRVSNVAGDGFGLGDRIRLRPNSSEEPQAAVTFESLDAQRCSRCDVYLYVESDPPDQVIFGIRITNRWRTLCAAELTVDQPVTPWVVSFWRSLSPISITLTTRLPAGTRPSNHVGAYVSYPMFF
jgi:hypothetical protein